MVIQACSFCRDKKERDEWESGRTQRMKLYYNYYLECLLFKMVLESKTNIVTVYFTVLSIILEDLTFILNTVLNK